MTAASARQGLLDTSTVILLPRLTDLAVLPEEPLISTITLAELSVGPLVATSVEEQAARQAHVHVGIDDLKVVAVPHPNHVPEQRT